MVAWTEEMMEDVSGAAEAARMFGDAGEEEEAARLLFIACDKDKDGYITR